jgi:hypothetical protein
MAAERQVRMIRHTWVVRVRGIGDPESISFSVSYEFDTRDTAIAAIERYVNSAESDGARVIDSGRRAFTMSGRNGELTVFIGMEQHSEIIDDYIPYSLDVILDEVRLDDDVEMDPDF